MPVFHKKKNHRFRCGLNFYNYIHSLEKDNVLRPNLNYARLDLLNGFLFILISVRKRQRPASKFGLCLSSFYFRKISLLYSPDFSFPHKSHSCDLQGPLFAGRTCLRFRNKKEIVINTISFLFWKNGNVLPFRLVSKQVLSALESLTSVFGMRTGGPLRHYHR